MTETLQRKFEIKPAVRSRVPLMIGLSGPSGAGKTYSALRLATGIKEIVGGEIVFIDTENQRARHYADLFRFRHIDFAPPYGSRDYLDALAAATRRPPGVIVIDSLSHEHEGEGGLLDFYSMELQRLAGDDPSPQQRAQLAAWRRPKAARRTLLTALLRLDAHLIVCFRATERTRHSRDPNATDPIEMGFTPIAGPEFIYELTLSALLRPGARGVPTWSSDRPGESLAVKLPFHFQAMFREGEPLNEQHGRALAQWAQSPTAAQPHPPRRNGRRALRLRDLEAGASPGPRPPSLLNGAMSGGSPTSEDA